MANASKWYEVIVDDFGKAEDQNGRLKFNTVLEAVEVALFYHARHDGAKIAVREVVQEVTDTVLFGGADVTDNR